VTAEEKRVIGLVFDMIERAGAMIEDLIVDLGEAIRVARVALELPPTEKGERKSG
jgi:hypothetical protein